MTNVSVQQPNRPAITIGTPINDVVNQNPPSGIQYASYETLWSGQETSYVTGDEGWRYQQGEFESYVLPNPERVMLLDPADPSGRTLIPDNIFGNKNRYTAPDGTQNYVEFNLPTTNYQMALFIDHYYGMIFAMFYNSILPSYELDLSQAISVASQINEQGYSGFSVMSILEMLSTLAGSSQPITNEQFWDIYPFFFDNGNGIISTNSWRVGQEGIRVQSISGRFKEINYTSARATDIRHYFYVKNIQSILQP